MISDQSLTQSASGRGSQRYRPRWSRSQFVPGDRRPLSGSIPLMTAGLGIVGGFVLASAVVAEEPPSGMVWIPGGVFQMGAEHADARADEGPMHRVHVSGFFIGIHEVTNAEFARFVEDTGYLTVAEREVDWEALADQVPPGTPKPPPELLQPGSLVFDPPEEPVSLRDPSAWWTWMPGASWKRPEGPGSTIEERTDHPVVHIAWEDAVA